MKLHYELLKSDPLAEKPNARSKKSIRQTISKHFKDHSDYASIESEYHYAKKVFMDILRGLFKRHDK